MKTKEAFTKWFYQVWDLYPFTYKKLLSGEMLLNYEYAFKFDIQNKAWEAAFEHTQAELAHHIFKIEAENAKLKTIIILAAEASCYTEYEDACGAARRCLKELEEK